MELHTYVHTYCYGPDTRIVNPLGNLCAIACVAENWSKGEPYTAYFVIEIDTPTNVRRSGWVTQDQLFAETDGWRVVKKPDAKEPLLQ
jgi:hypothetical protein